MVTVLSRSESLDLVLATWRPKGDEDHFDIPEVHVFEDCECEEDWHIPVAEARKKPACDCGCGGKCTGAGGCSGGAHKGSSKGRSRAKKQGRSSPKLATTNTPTPDVRAVSLGQPLGRSIERLRSETQAQGPFVDATFQGVEVQKNGTRTDSSGDCWVSVAEPPPENYEPGSPEWYAWWEGCVPTGPVGPGASECDLEQAWEEALSFCTLRCLEQIEEAYGQPWYVVAEDVQFDCWYDAVYYAWINDRCEVDDALCAHSSSGVSSALWAAGLAGSSIFGLLGVSMYLWATSGDSASSDAPPLTPSAGLGQGGTAVRFPSTKVEEIGPLSDSAAETDEEIDMNDPDWWAETASEEQRRVSRAQCGIVSSALDEEELRKQAPECAALYDGCGWPDEIEELGRSKDNCGTPVETGTPGEGEQTDQGTDFVWVNECPPCCEHVLC